MPRSRLLHPGSWPIATRMTVDLLVAALVPLAIATWLSASGSARELAFEAKENLELLATVTATRLDQLFVDTQRVVSQVAGDERIVAFCAGDEATRDRLRDAVQRRLELVTASTTDFASIFVTDADGIGLASTSAANVGMDLTFRDYWQRARAGERYVSEVLVGKNTRRPGVYLSMPVEHDGAIVGVTVLKLEGERLWDIVDAVDIGASGFAAIVDRDGIVLAHPDREQLYRSLGPLPPERVAAIDPETRYGNETIPSLGLPALARSITEARRAGSAFYDRPADRGGDEWIVGFAPMATKDWIVGVTLPESEFATPIRRLVTNQLVIALVIAGVAVAYALYRARTIVRPILSLTGAARRIADGDLEASAEAPFDNELGRLAGAFNAMVPQLKERMELRQSLEVATEVQQALLPESDPEREGLDIAGRSRYCDETGGDYYDFIDVSEVAPGCTLVALGDVMGHGLASALLMASARAAVRAQALDAGGLAELMTKVNRVLAADMRHGRFMTMVLMLVDRQRRTVRWASAAHDPTIVYRPSTDAFDELGGGGLPLGVLESETYQQFERSDLETGDVLLLGTDGIWETRNAEGEFYGKERLQELVRAHAAQPAAHIATEIESALRSFRGPERVLDDITFVIVKLT